MTTVKILVTAGGTQEYIDDVRVITNISTGKLGAQISDKLAQLSGVKIFHVCSKTAVLPSLHPILNMDLIRVRTAQDTFDTMKRIIQEEHIDVVIHSMAVSDFTFKRDSAIKLKSNDPEAFIEFMRQNIIPNPKIINHIKEWRPETILVGFKFEVGIPHEELIALAKKSIKLNGCDLVIANDKEEMKRLNNQGNHAAHFIFSDQMTAQHNFWSGMVFNKDEIAAKLQSCISQIFIEKVLV